MLEEPDGAEALRRLLDLPFVDAGRDGLVVHEAVRDAVAGFLRGTSPTRYRSYRRAAWRQLRTETREAAPAELWRYTADMLYLIDNPVAREAFFPSDSPAARRRAGTGRRRVRGRDRRAASRGSRCRCAVGALVAGRAGDVLRGARPERRRGGILHALRGPHVRRSLVASDPVLEAWARDLHEHPLPKGQLALGLRRWLDAERGELPCASQAACFLDVKRTYMALRPALRRMYAVVQDLPTYWPVLAKLGFRPLTEAAAILDGREYASVVLDFGPGSVDGWLASLAARELGVDDEPQLDESARELAVQGRLVSLTPLELGLFRHLREREGRIVTRSELLREVWGTEFNGGSNVVDAVVRTLRRKLGTAGPVVETVRGSGYRLRDGLARSHQLVPDPHRSLIAPSSNGTAARIPLWSSSIHSSPWPSSESHNTKEPHVRSPASHDVDLNRGAQAVPDDPEPGRSCARLHRQTADGEIRFHDWLGDSWGVLFSHPADFTPVCTTELGAVARLQEQFAERNTKVVRRVGRRARRPRAVGRRHRRDAGRRGQLPDDRRRRPQASPTLYDMIHPTPTTRSPCARCSSSGPTRRSSSR